MRNAIFILLIFLNISTFSQTSVEALKVNEIWEQFLSTLGNREIVSEIKTISFSTSMFFKSNNIEIQSCSKAKFPDKAYNEIITPNNDTIVYILNGEKGIIESNNTLVPLSKEELNSLNHLALIFAEPHFQRLGYKLELEDEVIINSNTYYNIRVNMDSQTVNYLIDKNDFHVFRIMGENDFMEITETIFLNGVRFIKSSKMVMSNDTIILTNFDHRINIELDDNIFNLN